jgi:glycosyltransferase involved in cell wall biosynthesis
MNYSVTVIISTKNRLQKLGDCLRSIKNCELSQFDLIVVDGSSPNINSEVEKLVESFGGRYVYEKKSGISLSKNIAIRLSKANILFFVDDDCLLKKGSLENLVKNYDNPNIMCVTGRIILAQNNVQMEELADQDKGSDRREYSLAKKPLKSLSLIRNMMRLMIIDDHASDFHSKSSLRENAPVPWVIGSGSNMSFRRTFFDLAGGFNENLGTGTNAKGGEDLDMFIRTLLNGFEIVYEPHAIVYHNQRHQPKQVFFDYGKGGGSLMIMYVHIPFFATQLFGRFINTLAEIFVTIIKRDKRLAYLRSWYFFGLLGSFAHAHKIRTSKRIEIV